MAEFKQNGDGSVSLIREQDSQEMSRSGGYMGPAGTSQPGYLGETNAGFNVNGASGSAGGILQWQNTLGYDIIVTGAQLDITTVSATAGTVSFGTGAGSATLYSNFINALSVAATATSNGGSLSVVVSNGSWITGSQATGSASTFVGRFYIDFKPRLAAGSK